MPSPRRTAGPAPARLSMRPEPAAAERTPDLLATFSAEEATDRRRLRRALGLALAAHLVFLATPRPQPRTLPVGASRAVAVFELRAARLAPPRPPAPVIVEREVPAEPPPAEEVELGRPAPPAVEVLFEAGDLSRLVAPRPLVAEVPAPPSGPFLTDGEVRLLLRLDEAGAVLDARPLAGDAGLAEAAVRAAKRWTFLPATMDGQPIPVVVEVVVRFTPPAPAPAGPG